jgi:hypothetical protein
MRVLRASAGHCQGRRQHLEWVVAAPRRPYPPALLPIPPGDADLVRIWIVTMPGTASNSNTLVTTAKAARQSDLVRAGGCAPLCVVTFIGAPIRPAADRIDPPVCNSPSRQRFHRFQSCLRVSKRLVDSCACRVYARRPHGRRKDFGMGLGVETTGNRCGPPSKPLLGPREVSRQRPRRLQ